jgi:hypothetical protein
MAQALRCVALARICAMLQKPDYITTELGIAQAHWASRTTTAELFAQLKAHVTAARQAFSGIEHPTREHRVWKSKLDTIEQSLLNQEAPSDREASGFTGVLDNEAARAE